MSCFIYSSRTLILLAILSLTGCSGKTYRFIYDYKETSTRLLNKKADLNISISTNLDASNGKGFANLNYSIKESLQKEFNNVFREVNFNPKRSDLKLNVEFLVKDNTNLSWYPIMFATCLPCVLFGVPIAHYETSVRVNVDLLNNANKKIATYNKHCELGAVVGLYYNHSCSNPSSENYFTYQCMERVLSNIKNEIIQDKNKILRKL